MSYLKQFINNKMFNQQYLLNPKNLTASRYSVPFLKKSLETQQTKIIKPNDQKIFQQMMTERTKQWSKQKQKRQNGLNLQEQRKRSVKSRNRGRSIIQFPQGIKSKIGFFPFLNINLQNKKQLIQGIKSVRDLKVSQNKKEKGIVKAEVLFNKNQLETIRQYNCQVFDETLHNFKSLYKKRLSSLQIQNKLIKSNPKNKPKIQIVIDTQITFNLNQQLYQQNKLSWKPCIGEDCIVHLFYRWILNIGGRRNSLFIPTYDMVQNRWIEKQKSKFLVQMAGTDFHTYNHHIIAFGGQLPVQNARVKNLTNKIISYDVKQKKYNILDEGSTIITSRRCHGSSLIENFLLVFGGINSDYKYLSDLHAFDLKQKRWETIQYECSQKIRKYLSSGIAKFKMIPKFYQREYLSIYEKQQIQIKNPSISTQGIYLFGGINQSGNILNKLLIIQIGISQPKIIQPITTGIQPPPRNDYGMSLFKNMLIIHGGRDDSKNPFILNDLFGLNLKTLEWMQIKIKNDRKFERYGHQLINYAERLYIFGGKDLKGINKDIIEYSI